MKLCKDCRWIDFPGASHPKCQHPTSTTKAVTSPVTGKTTPGERLPCETTRASAYVRIFPNLCGPDAQHWEPAGSPRGVGFV